MARIPEVVVQNVLDHTNIADVVSKYVDLRKEGKNLFGLCPFHEERTPSFSVAPDKQIFHCFSCGRGGNVFKFLMDLKGITFPQAVEQVADLDGIKLPDSVKNAQADVKNSHLEQLADIQKQAGELYHHVLLNTKLGEPARQYLAKRKLSSEMVEQFNLGFAPEQSLLVPYFEDKKTDKKLLKESGLFIEDQDGNLRDRFRGRVMFPILDGNGRTLGFSGRILRKDPDLPKYLNSPETELFNKRKIIFNLNNARPFIKQEGNLILFEGFMDVISAFQAGVKNGVASMGTSLTEEQIYQFRRLSRQIYVCYDGDEPGQKAINRAVNLLGNDGHFQLGVIDLPNGMDPDEFCRQYGNQKFQAEIKNGKETVTQFKLDFLKSQYNLSNQDELMQYIDACVNVIAMVEKPVERSYYLDELAKQYGLSTSDLKEQTEEAQQKLGKIQRRKPQAYKQNPAETHAEVQTPKREMSKVQWAESILFYRMVTDQNVWLKIMGDEDFSFADEDFQTLYLFAQHYFQTHDDYSPALFSEEIDDEKLQSLVSEINMLNLPKAASDQEIDDCVKIIKDVKDKFVLKQKYQEMLNASKMGDIERASRLAKEYHNLQKEEKQ